MGFNSILLQKYAFEARNQLINEYKGKYISKKGDRFNKEGITYEIANLFEDDTQKKFKFEISSKVPLETISIDIKVYFKKVKSIIEKNKSVGLTEITLEDRIKKVDNEETKQRDYIRLKFDYKIEDLYDTEKVNNAVKKLQEDPRNEIEVPDVPEVSSIPGKIVLGSVRDTFYHMTRKNIEHLINANEKVLSTLTAKP